ncbi:MAG TPA: hypothetical protein VJ803_01485 [Gemmatimonadaceae bacterium]|nr:hypothetical protein [Gemmatimonadaceae bacterium]
MRAIGRQFTMVLLLMILAGCSMARQGNQEPQEETSLRVENRGWSEMTIYVLTSTERSRLGTVSGNSTRVFTIPERLLFGATPLRFFADPLGGAREPSTRQITVTPGDQVTWIISN